MILANRQYQAFHHKFEIVFGYTVSGSIRILTHTHTHTGSCSLNYELYPIKLFEKITEII
ncbi:hypothetical protein Hdeb2414_s0020g00568371 [Helianthus debilis subsp. tardiflorus]